MIIELKLQHDHLKEQTKIQFSEEHVQSMIDRKATRILRTRFTKTCECLGLL